MPHASARKDCMADSGPGTMPWPEAINDPFLLLIRYAKEAEVRWPPSETISHSSFWSRSVASSFVVGSMVRFCRTMLVKSLSMLGVTLLWICLGRCNLI